MLQAQQPGQPALATWPENEMALEHRSVMMEVTVTNTPLPFYFWFHNGQPIAEATNRTLRLDDLGSSHAGTYSVLVSNQVGAVFSPEFTLTVLPPQPPLITHEPESQELQVGDTLVLTTEYLVYGPPLFQWRLNGVNIPAATNAMLIISNVQPHDAGRYTLAIQNDLGALESQPALVTVQLEALPMTDQFADQTIFTAPAGQGRTTNASATSEPGEPEPHGLPGGKSLWLTWQAPADGIATFDTEGSSFDTLLAVYTGETVTTLNQVASDEDRADSEQRRHVPGPRRTTVSGSGGRTERRDWRGGAGLAI